MYDKDVIIHKKEGLFMKRDLDLIREILLGIETHHTNKTTVAAEVGLNFKVEGHSKEAVAYHLKMLIDAGYVLGIETAFRCQVPLVYKRV